MQSYKSYYTVSPQTVFTYPFHHAKLQISLHGVTASSLYLSFSPCKATNLTTWCHRKQFLLILFTMQSYKYYVGKKNIYIYFHSKSIHQYQQPNNVPSSLLSLGNINIFQPRYIVKHVSRFLIISQCFFHSRVFALELINSGKYPSTSVTKYRQRLAERHVQSCHSCVHNEHWQIRFTKYNQMSWGLSFDQGAAVNLCFDWQERQFIKSS